MSEHKHHILPLKVYLGVGAALFVLTAITVWVSFFHFGAFNIVVAMLIATIKGSLVALYFMHLKYDNKFYLTIFVLSLVFLSIFIGLTMFDTLRRGELSREEAGSIKENARIYDQSTPAPAQGN